jgi:hypothetical protein
MEPPALKNVAQNVTVATADRTRSRAQIGLSLKDSCIIIIIVINFFIQKHARHACIDLPQKGSTTKQRLLHLPHQWPVRVQAV